VGKAPQAGLDAPQDDRHLRKEAVHPVGVDYGSPVRPEQGSARRVDVASPPLEGRCEVIDHGVDVAGGDAEEEAGAPQSAEVIGLFPVRLGDDPHAVASIPEHPADDRCGEAGMVDVSVSADEDHVKVVYAQLPGLCQGDGQKFRLLSHLYLSGGCQPLSLFV